MECSGVGPTSTRCSIRRVRGGESRLDPDLIDLLRLGAAKKPVHGKCARICRNRPDRRACQGRHGLGARKLVNAVLRRLDRERNELAPPTLSDAIEAHPRCVTPALAGGALGGAVRHGRHALLLDANNREAPLVARPYHAVREQLEAMLEAAGVRVEEAPLVRDSIVLSSPVSSFTELGPFRQGLFTFRIQRPRSSPSTPVYRPVLRRPISAPRPGEVDRTVAQCVACPVERRLAGAIEARRRERAAVGDRYAVGVRRRRAIPGHPAGRFRARRRAVHGHGNVPTASGRTMAAPHLGHCGNGGAAADDSAPRLRQYGLGGYLVYATCTLEPEENDEQIDAFLTEHPDWRLEPPPEGVVPATVLDNGRLRVLPHRHGTDGAFAARLRRPAA